VGGLKETLAVCARYARERRQFGRPLASYGLIQAKLGEMAARTFGLESAVYRLAGMLDEGFSGIQADAPDASLRYHRAAEEHALECSIVKVVGSELYSWATDEGIQIHGGYGYTEEFPMARAWRDQRLLRIGEGANEVVRLAIVNTLLRRASAGRIPLEPALNTAAHATAEEPAPGFHQATHAARIKTAALALLGRARQRFGDGLSEEQEVCAAIADLMGAAFVVESAWLRLRRLKERDFRSRASSLAEHAALLCTEWARRETLPQTEAALLRVSRTGRLDSEDMRPLYPLMAARTGADAIGLRRELARAVLDAEGWPWPDW